MVFYGFSDSPDANYLGPLQFSAPKADPVGNKGKEKQEIDLLSCDSQQQRAQVLRGIACAAVSSDGTQAAPGCSGGNSIYRSHAAKLQAERSNGSVGAPRKWLAGGLAGLPLTAVLSTSHPHHAVHDHSITYNVAGVVNPLALVDPYEHHSVVLYKVAAPSTPSSTGGNRRAERRESSGSGGASGKKQTSEQSSSELVAMQIASIPTKGLKYLHSFALTESFAVIVLWPCHIDVLGLALGQPVLQSIMWDGAPARGTAEGPYDEYDTQTRVFAVRLSDGEIVANVTTDPFFAYHHVNAFESSDPATGEVVLTVDTTAFNDTGTMKFWEMANIRNSTYRNAYPDNTRIRRLSIRPSGGSVNRSATGKACSYQTNATRGAAREEMGSITYQDIEAIVTPGTSRVTVDGAPPVVVQPGSEFAGMRFSGPELPRINYGDRNGRTYCFVYGYSGHAFESEVWEAAAVVKVDLCSLEPAQPAAASHRTDGVVRLAPVSVWARQDVYPSEPVFVPSPSPRSEDDGVLLFDAYDGRKKQSFLWVINATTMEDVSVMQSPVTVAWPLHAQFFPK